MAYDPGNGMRGIEVGKEVAKYQRSWKGDGQGLSAPHLFLPIIM